jgi:NADH-quinone oxidoreductase subunit N
MTAGGVLTLTPLAVLGLAPVVVMLVTALRPSHRLAMVVSLAGLAAGMGTLAVSAGRGQRQVTALLRMDDFALLLIGLLSLATAGVVVLSYLYLRDHETQPLEYYTLLLIANFGGATLVAATHFASFFLGLEILSVSLYALIGYPRLRGDAVEAAVKYLILAAATAAALLFGMALIYAQTGRMDFASLHAADLHGAGATAFYVAGLALIVVGVGFKLALVPFHMWTPDVYQGAPAPVTAFVATVSKGAMIAILLRFFRGADYALPHAISIGFTVIAVASMAFGNLLALLQDNVKRILAYSSISHLGYVLVPIVAGGRTAAAAVVFYLVAYVLTMLGAFGIVGLLSEGGNEAEDIEQYRGLAFRRPWLAGAFAAVLFSLAGIPLTAGFIGKFYLVTAGAGASLWLLLIVLVLTSTIGLYYYTRIVVVMYVGRPEAATPEPPAVRFLGAPVMTAVIALLFFLGIYPGPLVHLIQHVVDGLR